MKKTFICERCGFKQNKKSEELTYHEYLDQLGVPMPFDQDLFEYGEYCGSCAFDVYVDYHPEYGYDKSKPYGCVACGGPYPDCKASCPIFDED